MGSYTTINMTTATPTARLRNATEEWSDYIDYLNDAIAFEDVRREDYENFNAYYSALMKVKQSEGVKSDVNKIRCLVASLRITDMPEVHELSIEYYGGGDSGEIVEIICNKEQVGPRYTPDQCIMDELDSAL